MVYESDFYTTRRPYRPATSTYSMSPLTDVYYLTYPPSLLPYLYQYNYNIPYVTYTPKLSQDVHKLINNFQFPRSKTDMHVRVKLGLLDQVSEKLTRLQAELIYRPRTRTVTRLATYPEVPHHIVRVRVRPSVIMRELDRIQHRVRPNYAVSALDDFYRSNATKEFEDEARRIRADTASVLQRARSVVPRAKSVLPLDTIHSNLRKYASKLAAEDSQNKINHVLKSMKGILRNLENKLEAQQFQASIDKLLRHMRGLLLSFQYKRAARDFEAKIKKIYNKHIKGYGYGEPLPYRFSNDAYITRLILPLRNVADTVRDTIKHISYWNEPARRFTGRGHLACVHYSGNKAFSNRHPLYKNLSIRDDVNLLSFYAKNRLAAAGLGTETATVKLLPWRPSRKFQAPQMMEDPALELKAQKAERAERFRASTAEPTLTPAVDLAEIKRKRQEEMRAAEEKALKEEAKREAERKAQADREAAEKKAEEEARKAEEAKRKAEEEAIKAEEEAASLAAEIEAAAIAAEEAKKAEEARLAEEAKKAEKEAKRKAEEEARKAEEEAKKAEEVRLAEEARLAEEEQRRQEELARLAELEKQAEEEKEAELARQAAELAEMARQESELAAQRLEEISQSAEADAAETPAEVEASETPAEEAAPEVETFQEAEAEPEPVVEEPASPDAPAETPADDAAAEVSEDDHAEQEVTDEE